MRGIVNIYLVLKSQTPTQNAIKGLEQVPDDTLADEYGQKLVGCGHLVQSTPCCVS